MATDPTRATAAAVIHVVYPGTVRSRHDGDIHSIGFLQLCRLYGLDPQSPDVLNADRPGTALHVERLQREPNVTVRHYAPRQDGNYGR